MYKIKSSFKVLAHLLNDCWQFESQCMQIHTSYLWIHFQLTFIKNSELHITAI